MNHVPDNLLFAFVEGELDETLAVHVAEHIDGCAACLARTVALDPLSAAFAAVPDPVAPRGLAASVLARAEAVEPRPTAITTPALRPLAVEARLPWRELLAGTVLLTIAAGLSAWADPMAMTIATDPMHVLSGVLRLLEPMDSLANAARAAFGTTSRGLVLAAAMAACGMGATWRLATAPPATGASGDALAGGIR